MLHGTLQSFVRLARLKLTEDKEDPPRQGHGLGPEASVEPKCPDAHKGEPPFWV